jgi:hypothetical protein
MPEMSALGQKKAFCGANSMPQKVMSARSIKDLDQDEKS